MFARKTKILEFGDKKVEVHDLTVAEVEDILQTMNEQKEDEINAVAFIYKDVDKKIFKLATNLTDDEIKQMPENVSAKVRDAIKELNPFFTKAINELIEAAQKMQQKVLQSN